LSPSREPEHRLETVAPVVPTARASVRLRPLDLRAVRVESGLWAERRETNRNATIPHGLAKLELAGNLQNLRLAAGQAEGAYGGGSDDSGSPFPFLDTDVYKWLEAVGWELGQTPDAKLEADADRVVALVAAAQRADGYLNSYYQVKRRGEEFTDLAWGHELYSLGHLAQAAVAWRRSLGDDRLLAVAERAVARAEAELGPSRRELIDGHPEIEMALVELYRTTGKGRYLEFAKTLIERRGHGLLGDGRFGARYWQDHEPVRKAASPGGHAVRQVYLDAGVADLAVETADPELLQAVVRRWEVMVASRTYLTGALGSRHRDEAFGDAFELPPDRAYAETCAAIGSVMLAWRLLLATGEGRFADLIERTSLNAVLAGIALDGRHFFYSNPLQRRAGTALVPSGAAAATSRSPWFACSCCPPNLMRFLATMPDLVATVDERGLQIHQFATAAIEARVRGGDVRLQMRTDYPWAGRVDIEVLETSGAPWTLTVRVPEWCRSVRADVEGSDLAITAGAAICLERAWQPGDRMRIDFEMSPRATLPDPRIDAVRGTVAIERGPLVYAVEERDLPPGVSIDSLEVGLPLRAAPARQGSGALAPGIVPLAVEAGVREATPESAWPYHPAAEGSVPEEPTADASEVTVQAVPYLAWGNRGGSGMRVWLPIRDARGPREG
jgi:DUF1680 family protein